MSNAFDELTRRIQGREASVDVVAFGESSVDFVGVTHHASKRTTGKSPLSAFDIRSGGQAATAAVACARQGIRARYVGVLGEDELAARVRESLAREGVDTAIVTAPSAASRIAMILVDEATGQRTVFEHRDPRLSVWRDRLPMRAIAGGKLLLVDATDISASLAAVATARREGVVTLVDIDHVTDRSMELLSGIDVVIVPAEFPEALVGPRGLGDALGVIASECRAALVVATLGEEGSLAWQEGHEIHTAPYRVNAIDTTGAGDAFRGGFMSAWIRFAGEANLLSLLEYANATAALNCRMLGAQAGLPTWPEVHALVTERVGTQSK